MRFCKCNKFIDSWASWAPTVLFSRAGVCGKDLVNSNPIRYFGPNYTLSHINHERGKGRKIKRRATAILNAREKKKKKVPRTVVRQSTALSERAGHLAELDSTPHQRFRWHVLPSPHSVAQPVLLHDEDRPCRLSGSYLPRYQKTRLNLSV